MKTTHEDILAASEFIQPWLLDYLNQHPTEAINVFDGVGLAIEFFELPSDAVVFDLQSGRGLLRIRVEWDLWELEQQTKIKKVGPNTYQSLAGPLPVYTGQETTIKRNSITNQKNSLLVSGKILRDLGQDKDQVLSSLRECPAFQGFPTVAFFVAVKEIFA